MSDNSHLDIDYVARLARIALTDDEKTLFGKQLEDVLTYIDQLEAVDVSNVEPTAHAFDVVNVWREDEACDGLTHAAALQNASAMREGMFIVPKVIDEA